MHDWLQVGVVRKPVRNTVQAGRQRLDYKPVPWYAALRLEAGSMVRNAETTRW